MPEYRIRKGEREYVAQKLETLNELVRRGLVAPADEVSVDGGPYTSLGDLPGLELDGLDDSGPWRHWDDAREGKAASGVLSDFLGEIASPASSLSPTEPSPPTEPPPPTVEPLPDLPLDALEPAGTSPGAPDPGDAAPEPVPEAPPPQPEAPTRHQLRLIEPEADAPVSFADWVDQRGDGNAGGLLKDFGKVDDGVVLHGRRRSGPNWWRAAGLVLVGGLMIAGWHTWVRTIALTSYPTEAELIADQQGDNPALPAIEEPSTVPTPSPSARAQEQRLRSRVDGAINQFADSEGLENALFAELSNLRVNPLQIKVDTTRVASGDYQPNRPIEAALTVKLGGIDDDQVDTLIRERLFLAWFVVGKYGRKGKVTFNSVTVAFGAPSPFQETRAGRRLEALWDSRVTATQLLLEE